MFPNTLVTPVPYRVAPETWAGRSATVELVSVPGGYDVFLAGEHLGHIWVDRVKMTGETAWAATTPHGVEPRRTARTTGDMAAMLVFLVEARTSRVMGRAFAHSAETYLPLSRYRCAHMKILRTRSNARRTRSWRGLNR